MIKDNTGKLYYIGGIVRDKILGKESFDIDLTFEGDAIEFAQKLNDVKIIKINEPFGTVRVISDDKEIDIASTRAEIYEKPGHLPTVTKIGCDLKEDVLRRDFTINSLAQNYNSEEIIDYTGGLEDIKHKLIRVLHDKSFIDDPTRILRALKFAVRFNFKLEEHTKNLRDKYLCNINYDMSYKRLKKELIETFNLNLQIAYDEFIDSGMYKLVTPKDIIKPKENIEKFILKYIHLINPSNIWLIYIGTLQDLTNLELTKNEQKIINDLNNLLCQNFNNDFHIYKSFEKCYAETIVLYAILCDKKIAEHYINDLMDIKLNITGKDLKNIGISPSNSYDECFNYILKEKLKNKQLTYNDEIALARKYFAERHPGGK